MRCIYQRLLIFFLLATFFLNLEGRSRSSKDFFRDKTTIKDPFSLRDPFKSPELGGVSKKGKASELRDGIFTNIVDIENFPLEKIQIVGVMLGKNRRAIAKIDNKDTVIIKEGMKLGIDKAEIKAILPGGVVLVEKIVNIYGQNEYLETVLPIVVD